MSRKVLFVLCLGFLFLAWGVYSAAGQDGEEAHPIVTTATDSVGVGTYVAAQAFAFPANEEDPAAFPLRAQIIPYGIYPNMLVMDIAEFEQPEALIEGMTFAWSLAVPEGSAASFVQEGNVAIFLTDVEGTYDITLTVTDEAGATAETTWRVYATTYVGVGGIAGELVHGNCINCHEDKWEGWKATGHSDMLVRGLEGTLSSHYSEACISCHTTGFSTLPTAVNGGFDDLSAEAGWEFPAELTAGNWDAFVAEYPQVAALANIQCESCHGPGHLHTTEGTRDDRMIGRGLDYGTCAQCHAEDPYHVFPQQWENSGHGEINARAFTYPVGEDERSCVRCHSGEGYIDYVKGIPEEELRVNYQPITCAVCHDPHNVDNPNQLRVFDTVILPNGFEVTDAGPSATCMTCHNVRRDGGAEGQVAGVLAGGRFSVAHEFNSAAEMVMGTGGFTWGATLPISTHSRAVDDSCVGCHMAPTPGMDNMGTPDDSSDDQPLPGHNTVGEHTFAVVDANGVENIAVCQQCHDWAESFEFVAFHDYDGDGTIETNVEEITGLREALWAALEAQGVTPLESRPYFTPPEGAGEDIYGAVWNYFFTARESVAVHNLRYTVALLQLSYEKVAGQPLANAYILPPK